MDLFLSQEFLAAITRVTGWLAASFLVLNFLSCWAMPWSRKYKRALLREEEGIKQEAKPLCFYHTPLAWIAISFALVHMILAVLTY